jgi:hypothetical protein
MRRFQSGGETWWQADFRNIHGWNGHATSRTRLVAVLWLLLLLARSATGKRGPIPR